MFDTSTLPDLDTLAGVDDATLVGALAGFARVSAAADARRLAAVAELARRRCIDDADDERQYWPVDPTDAAAAEVAAALNMGHRRAVGQLYLAAALQTRLPKVNALFAAGLVTEEMVSRIAWRTTQVDNDDVMAQLDAHLAAQVRRWGPLSTEKLIKAVDQCVHDLDPAAVYRTRSAARDRNVTVGDREDSDGTVAFWGRLLGPDGVLVDRRLTTMAKGVCKDDPRTLEQRRADAMGAWGAGADHLACRCGNPDCPAAAGDGRASNVVIHIVGDRSMLDAQPDPLIHGDGTSPAAPESVDEPEAEATEESEPEPGVAETQSPSRPAVRPGAGFIIGGGIVPPALVAEWIAMGATVRFVSNPCTEGEPQYRPSTGLAEFDRVRDMTCRFPGCDRPADQADLDHTIAWPTGPTHPCNTKAYCRRHHLLKTLWADDGWADRQLADGTVVITTPAGSTYTTKPVATLLFPNWNILTPPPPQAPKPKGAGPRSNDLDTFKRKRTRAKDREYRIQAERERAAADIAARAAAAKAATAPVVNRDSARGTMVGTPEFHEWTQAIREYNATQTGIDEPPPF
jgi:hypothetical protein